MSEINKLLDIMSALREPETGCPWDIEQDFASVVTYTIEEAYEVADAIERGDMSELKDELGDLLFQVVFHAQMAQEQGDFCFDDVVKSINDKLTRRHPHVFGDEQVESMQQLEKRWQQHKQKERDGKDGSSKTLDGIASALPALRWSQKIQQRAAATGFDWPDIAPVFEKLEEEVAELKQEIALQDNHARIMDELGDVLFVCVNLAMHLEVNAEQAMRHANKKFISRFTAMETLMQDEGAQLADLTLEQMEEYWQKTKLLLAANNAKGAK
jgi:ATP diphosphatase